MGSRQSKYCSDGVERKYCPYHRPRPQQRNQAPQAPKPNVLEQIVRGVAEAFGLSGQMKDYRKAADQPLGTMEAGNVWVDGQPGYYEDGAASGKSGQRERYSGPNGPFGPGHHHDRSKDDGETWERRH